MTNDAAYDDEDRARRFLLVGLAGLWLVDTALQLQPAMFTPGMAKWMWAAAAAGNPGWLAGLVSWSIAVTRPWLPAFDALLAALQLAAGGALLIARRPAARAAALWGSLALAMAVWVVGEGMGGLLAGGPSLLTGAPGSALLYAAASAALLLPAGSWRRLKRRWGLAPAQVVLVAVLTAGVVWQFSSGSWTDPLGLSAVPGANVMMPQPAALRAALVAASALAVRAPLLVNALLAVALAGAAVGVACAQWRRWTLPAVLALLGVLWVCGQDAGLLFSGGATDPNTMPLMALFVCTHWVSGARPRAAPPPSPRVLADRAGLAPCRTGGRAPGARPFRRRRVRRAPSVRGRAAARAAAPEPRTVRAPHRPPGAALSLSAYGPRHRRGA